MHLIIFLDLIFCITGSALDRLWQMTCTERLLSIFLIWWSHHRREARHRCRVLRKLLIVKEGLGSETSAPYFFIDDAFLSWLCGLWKCRNLPMAHWVLHAMHPSLQLLFPFTVNDLQLIVMKPLFINFTMATRMLSNNNVSSLLRGSWGI